MVMLLLQFVFLVHFTGPTQWGGLSLHPASPAKHISLPLSSPSDSLTRATRLARPACFGIRVGTIRHEQRELLVISESLVISLAIR